MWKVLKLLLALMLLAVIGLGVLARLGLERVARTAATASENERVHWKRSGARVFPPSVVLHDVSIGTARGEAFRAQRCEALLLPGAWTGYGRKLGAPSCESWTAIVRLPRSGGSNWTNLAGSKGLPASASGKNGRIEIWVGDDPPAPTLVLENATLAIAKGTLKIRAAAAASTFSVEGKLGESFAGSIALANAEAVPLTAFLVAPGSARVIGGSLSIEAKITMTSERVSLRGTVNTRDVVVEGGPRPGAVEALLARHEGDAKIGLELDARLDQGADWTARVRDSLRP